MSLSGKHILLLADCNSPHLQKWALALTDIGYAICVFSLSPSERKWFEGKNIIVYHAGITKEKINSTSIIQKLNYLKTVFQVKKIIKNFKPDIVHAHYASSYGLIGALCNFHPFIISVWGSDIMEFPLLNKWNKYILKFNFKKADQLFATSKLLVKVIADYSDKTPVEIPFGINTQLFNPIPADPFLTTNECVIGTVKSLENIYGIDLLIKSFKIVLDKNINKNLKLLIIGTGSKELEYKKLVDDLNLTPFTIFTGKVDYSQIVYFHNKIDIFVNVSRNESFGVSVLEASACEKPVIVSDVGGLKEVMFPDKTGILVHSENCIEIANAMELLISNPSLRHQMGIEGRKFVQRNFELQKNVNTTIAIYEQLISEN